VDCLSLSLAIGFISIFSKWVSAKFFRSSRSL